jgi:hypothetical protein
MTDRELINNILSLLLVATAACTLVSEASFQQERRRGKHQFASLHTCFYYIVNVPYACNLRVCWILGGAIALALDGSRLERRYCGLIIDPSIHLSTPCLSVILHQVSTDLSLSVGSASLYLLRIP